MLPRVEDRPLQRTFVIGLGSNRTFTPYQPAGVAVGGFAPHEAFMPCIVRRSDRSDPADDAFRTVVHEYFLVPADESSMSFYAESWLLVHHLMRATPEKGSQIAKFIDLLSAGATEASALEQAIGPPAKVHVALRRHLGTLPLYGEERPVAAAAADVSHRRGAPA